MFASVFMHACTGLCFITDVLAHIVRTLVTELFSVQDNNNSDVWLWILVQIPDHFEGIHGPQGPRLLYKTFISSFNSTSSHRGLNNKYPGLHHLSHRSRLNQALNLSPLTSSVSHYPRAPGSALHHLKSPQDFLINVADLKWLQGLPWDERWGVQPVSPEAA